MREFPPQKKWSKNLSDKQNWDAEVEIGPFAVEHGPFSSMIYHLNICDFP